MYARMCVCVNIFYFFLFNNFLFLYFITGGYSIVDLDFLYTYINNKQTYFFILIYSENKYDFIFLLI